MVFSLSKLRSSPMRQFSFQTLNKSFGSCPLHYMKAMMMRCKKCLLNEGDNDDGEVR